MPQREDGAITLPLPSADMFVSDIETKDKSEGWTKLSQAEAMHAIQRHEAFLERRNGGQRALLTFHDLSGLDLSGVNLREAEMTGIKFRNTNLASAQLQEAEMFGADLGGANMRAADLTRPDLRGAFLKGADLTEAKLIRTDLREGTLARYDENRNTVAVAVDDAGSDLGEVTARRVDFSQSKLANAFVEQTDFTDAILRNASFHSADLRHSVFDRAMMQGADLSQTNLGGASFKQANLKNANFFGADTEDTNFEGALLEPDALSKTQSRSAVNADANAATLGERLAFLEKLDNVEHHPVPQEAALARMDDARGNLMEDEFLLTHLHRVSGVGATLVAGNDVDVLGQHVDDLAFPFISPLCANDCEIHFFSFF